MSAERLRLVTDFAELRAGMIVYDKACNSCGRAWCRAMTIRLIPACRTQSGKESWEAVPYCGRGGAGHFNGIRRDTVAAGRVYRVDDGLDDASTEDTTASRPREMERTR